MFMGEPGVWAFWQGWVWHYRQFYLWGPVGVTCTTLEGFTQCVVRHVMVYLGGFCYCLYMPLFVSGGLKLSGLGLTSHCSN